MYECFTDRARNAWSLAHKSAVAGGREYIEPADLLIGLIREGSGIAARVLDDVCEGGDRLARAVEQTMPPGTPHDGKTKLPMSPQSHAAIASAIDEATRLKHNYVGTEHVLMGLLKLPDSPLVPAFQAIGVDPGEVYRRTLELMGVGASE
jgi:ATP-dependent Clp protease ATP-binding subunit ClpC